MACALPDWTGASKAGFVLPSAMIYRIVSAHACMAVFDNHTSKVDAGNVETRPGHDAHGHHE